MVQQSEIVSLLLAFALAPMMYSAVRRTEFEGKTALFAGVVFMLLSYVFTVAETWVWFSVLNLAEHASLGAAGVSFAIGVTQLVRGERKAAA